jgi:hypothetical protein
VWMSKWTFNLTTVNSSGCYNANYRIEYNKKSHITILYTYTFIKVPVFNECRAITNIKIKNGKWSYEVAAVRVEFT